MTTPLREGERLRGRHSALQAIAAALSSSVILAGCLAAPAPDLPPAEVAVSVPATGAAQSRDVARGDEAPATFAHDNLYATLYLQNAAEHKALTRLVYTSATARLDEALGDPRWTAAPEQSGDFSHLPPAVIFDVDETVLDNSGYQATLIAQGISYSTAHWDKWVADAVAPAVAGATEFSRAAHSRGVTLLYLTNRRCIERQPGGDVCPQRGETIRNLVEAGFPPPDPANVFLRSAEFDFARDKRSRRAEFARRYRILMLFGDDLGDFLPGVKGEGATAAYREEAVQYHAEKWGRAWFVLPNPSYGSWLEVLGEDPVTSLRPWKEKPRDD